MSLVCAECDKTVCRNGDDCRWNDEGRCKFCHCIDKVCQNFDDCGSLNIKPCDDCGTDICENCRVSCEQCEKEVCAYNTASCGEKCDGCKLWFCVGHLVETPDDSEYSSLCGECYDDMKDIVHGDYSDRDGHEYDDDY